jgi:hypothetical protein
VTVQVLFEAGLQGLDEVVLFLFFHGVDVRG